MDLRLLIQKQKLLFDRATEIERRYVLARALNNAIPVRHKCFVSYHSEDIDAVTQFVDDFNDVFIPRVVGASDSDNFKDPVTSDDVAYVMRTIREKYLRDSTVSIVFTGKCVWSRKFLDWEIASTLRNDNNNKRSGLMAITPQSRITNTLPARLKANVPAAPGSPSYGRYYYYPKTKTELREWIEDSFNARTSRSNLVDNTLPLRARNSPC